MAAGELAGIVILANDSVASTDGLFCKVNRTSGKLHVFKRVAGIDTDLINTTITYSEGAQGCVVHDKSEGKIWAFYNNAIVGEAQALTDVSGTWHGILTTGTATITAVGFAPLGYGAELLVNGNMEAGNPPSNWVDKGGATLSSVADERTGGSGTAALHGITGAGSASVASQTITTVVGSLYRVDGWIKNIDGTGVLFVIRTGTGI